MQEAEAAEEDVRGGVGVDLWSSAAKRHAAVNRTEKLDAACMSSGTGLSDGSSNDLNSDPIFGGTNEITLEETAAFFIEYDVDLDGLLDLQVGERYGRYMTAT